LSFIEKNKAWLLPLLGLGILGVGFMNFQALREAPPPAELASPETAPSQSEAQPGTLGAQPLETPPAGGSEDLWSDLRPFAELPGNLAQEGVLRDRARVALALDQGAETPLHLGKPGWTSLTPQATQEEGPALAGAEGSLPELDFLIHSPRGSFAWFGGRPYRTGEKLLESGYTLSRIGPTFVELTGPQGKLVESTIPVQATAHPSAETP